VDKQTLDKLSKDTITEIVTDIKKGTYRFKPIKRVYIDKKGEDPDLNKKAEALYKQKALTKEKQKEINARPLGVPTFKDRIVQEALRLIINAIYEPLFEEVNSNFGFRPKKGCHDAILLLELKAKAMNTALEGDIKGAFDNVKHHILMKILSRKIKDKKFMALIYQGLKCGIFFAGIRENSELGVTQGSIVSPLLFNIYMHEFDCFIKYDLIKKIEEKNIIEGRKPRVMPARYNTASKEKSLTKYWELKSKLAQTYKRYGKDSPILKKEEEALRIVKAKYDKWDKIQRNLPSTDLRRQLVRTFYYRYADDWILLTNDRVEKVKELKEQIRQWFLDNLELELSEKKTKVTDLNGPEPAKFLGFEIRTRQTGDQLNLAGKTKTIRTDVVRRSRKTKVKIEDPTRINRQRPSTPTLILKWDRKRVLAKMEQKRYITRSGDEKLWKGCKKAEWTTLELHEIVNRYNMVIRGLVNYYGPITTQPTDLHQLHYLLTYSCYHTVANKLNCKISDVMKKFTKDLKISWVEKTQSRSQGTTEKQKSAHLLNWGEVRHIIGQRIIDKIQRTKIPVQHLESIFDIKVNFRTKYKLAKYCCICGSTEKVELHHIRHVRVGKVDGFLQIMKQLNRKQIPCCKLCHVKIHRGEYDGMKLSDLYDEELIIL
jgi:group II intron reverse transcriptase/maturase